MTNSSPLATGHSPLAPTHALSFDIEDWFHIVEVAAVEDPAQWSSLSQRFSLVERETDRLLATLAKANVRATFFVLGWIAQRHPALVARIAAAGHELGTHSYWHRRVYELSREEFAKDIRDSIDAIHAAAGKDAAVRGFRAPSFSITPGTEWAFDVLMELGITYDASLFPASRGHGGYACPRGAHVLHTPAGRRLAELPMSVAKVGVGPVRKEMCYSGGGYLRLLPAWMIEQGVQRELAAGRPTVVYLHPRDFAPDTPRVPMPLHRRFKCYVGAGTTTGKLETLLSAHAWGTCQSVLQGELAKRGVAWSAERGVERVVAGGGA